MGLNKTSVAGKSRCAILAGGGGGRPARPSPSTASRRLRHPRRNHARPPRPAASGLGARPRGGRLDPPARGGSRGNAEHERAGDAVGGGRTRYGCGPLRWASSPAGVRGRSRLAPRPQARPMEPVLPPRGGGAPRRIPLPS